MKEVQPPRTSAAILARRRSSDEAVERIKAVLLAMRKDRVPITVQGVAKRAGVSRTFCYQRQEARKLIDEAKEQAHGARLELHHEAAAATEMTWRERALNAEAQLRTTIAEIHSQRRQIGELHGKLRDLELDMPADSVQRLRTENSTLKQRLRTMTSEYRTAQERLAAARDNTRSQDRIISQLQAQIVGDPVVPASRLRSVSDPTES